MLVSILSMLSRFAMDVGCDASLCCLKCCLDYLIGCKRDIFLENDTLYGVGLNSNVFFLVIPILIDEF